MAPSTCKSLSTTAATFAVAMLFTAGPVDPTVSQELSEQTIVVAGATAVVVETDTERKVHVITSVVIEPARVEQPPGYHP